MSLALRLSYLVRSQRRRAVCLCVLLTLACALQIGRWAAQGPVSSPPRFDVPPPTAPVRLQAVSTHDLPMPAGVPSAHASTLAALPSGEGVVALWFAGTGESEPDVQIVGSVFRYRQGNWSAPQVVINRQRLAQKLGFGVRRLGNPVAWFDAAGRLHVFVVATGPGGWAASRLAQVTFDAQPGAAMPWATSAGDDRAWHARVLPLSPFWNLSHLVRCNPVPLAGEDGKPGGALLPIYFELGMKNPEALRLGPMGEPMGLTRIAAGSSQLQPALVPLDDHRAMAFMRDISAEHRVQQAITLDGGRHWSPLPASPLRNPNASIAAVRLPDGSVLMALNPSSTERRVLALQRSNNGLQWPNAAQVIEQADPALQHVGPAGEPPEYSYPALLVDGPWLHLSYTYHRTHIRHRMFRLDAAPAEPAFALAEPVLQRAGR